MSRRRWKAVQPTSLRHALELCKDHAREVHNRSVERIADLMGLPDHWALYKWLQNGRMPASCIRPFEQACGIDLVTRWIAASAGRLLVDMPTGKTCKATDIQQLQELLHAAAGGLIDFYAGKAEQDDVLGIIQGAMTALAWHRRNVEQHDNPQLELGAQQ